MEALKAVIDEVVGCDSFELEAPDVLVELERQLSRLESVVARAAGAFDASGAWGSDGARSAPAWIATTCHLPKSAARRQVRRGRELCHLRQVGSAWAKGEITGSHVDEFIALRRPSTQEALERDEGVLVGQARRLTFEHFVRAASYWEQLADPDGVEDQAATRHARRDVYLTQSLGGSWLGQMTFDPISGAIVANELERIETELFEADWAKAKEELGRDPHLSDLGRTSGQRRADALVEMATRSASAPADGRRPEPLFSVLVGYETFHGRICQLAQGAAVTPGSLVPWLERSWLERAVFAPDGRVEVGCRARLFSGATRRAIEIRDQECTHPFCDEPAANCECDHIIPWSQDGPTTQANGRLLCGYHNRLRNQRPPPPEEPQ